MEPYGLRIVKTTYSANPSIFSVESHMYFIRIFFCKNTPITEPFT